MIMCLSSVIILVWSTYLRILFCIHMLNTLTIRHHFLRDHMQKGDITLEFVCINDQLGDIFTKPLYDERFCTLRREVGMIDGNEIAWLLLCYHDLNFVIMLVFVIYLWYTTCFNYFLCSFKFWVFMVFLKRFSKF